jgi:uncharacterized YccA/Bax inhibitor family protein
MRSGNPALNANTFTKIGTYEGADKMTINGTVNKTIIMTVLLTLTAAWAWNRFDLAAGGAPPTGWLIGSGLGGLVVGLITVFKKTWAHITAPLYAMVEGIFLGIISMFAETAFPGIVIQAVALTMGVLFALLMAYRSGLIKVTENFKLGVVAATGAIGLIYLVSWIMSMFGGGMPYIHENGLIGIGFSLFVIVIASLNLVLDFDFIEQGAEQGAPKYMEWYGAFGLMVTLIWLYIEILRLLMKLASRD